MRTLHTVKSYTYFLIPEFQRIFLYKQITIYTYKNIIQLIIQFFPTDYLSQDQSLRKFFKFQSIGKSILHIFDYI